MIADPHDTTYFEINNPPGSDGGGDIKNVEVTFDQVTGEMIISVTTDPSSDGFTIAVNDGPNPKGHAGELELDYFDASGETPVVTSYAYNGQNTQTSWKDGSPESGQQPPDQIASSLNEDSPFSNVDVSVDENGDKVMTFTVDTNASGTHDPAYPGPGGAEEWTGMSIGESVGIWLHPVNGLETSYDDNGFLEQWSTQGQGWYDTSNQPTEEGSLETEKPCHYEVTAEVEATFGDYIDGSENHFVWIEVPTGWQVADTNLEISAGTDDGESFVKIPVDNADILAGDGTVTIPINFTAPLSAGDQTHELSFKAQALEGHLPDETNYDNNEFVSGGTLEFTLQEILDGGEVTGSWDENLLAEPDNASDSDPNSDDVIFGSSENDLFLFGSLENGGALDGIDGPTWIESIETGDVGGPPPGIEEAGWTQGIEDGGIGEHDGHDAEGGDGGDRIRTEEHIDGVDDSDTIEW